jgi:glycosyltransferase involved in cell wall biosynthesis
MGVGDRMKLLFVHQHLGEFGGAETNIFLTASELSRRGHQVGLLYAEGTQRNEQSWRDVFSQCFCVSGRGNIEVVEAVLEQFAPDVIYLHNLSDLQVLETLLNSPAPVVRMVHDHALYCLRGYKYNYFTRKPCQRAASLFCVFPCLASIARNRRGGLPLRWVSYAEKLRELELNRRCDTLIVYSDHLRQELVRNGFDRQKIQMCVPIQLAGTGGVLSSFSDRNLIVFAGQLIRGKGVDVLVRALAKLTEPFECLILGDGHHRRHCERLAAKLGLQNRVRFQGYVLPAQVKEYYREASVFVMSSLWPEPFGMAGPEAMRYGLPVVAFDVGGIKEWLREGENGFLVPWKDTSRFAVCVDRLLRDKALARRMGRCALAGVEQYEAAAQISKLEQVFAQTLRSGARVETAIAASQQLLPIYG